MVEFRDAVITIVHGYDYPFVEPFIKSLRETNFQGQLVVFTSNTVSRATKFMLKRSGALLISFVPEFPFIPEYSTVFQGIDKSISINNYRFLLFLSFIKTNKSQYDRILLTDIRDVIFQTNPFQFVEADKIYFFLEDESQTFGNSKLNFDWYAKVFGAKSAISISTKIVSCAGVTTGGTNQVIEYLEYIKKKLLKISEPNWGVDQGIHNGYVYQEPNENLQLISNEQAFVFTAGACSSYSCDESGLIVNRSGQKYSIVHQYDRIQPLFLSKKRHYVGPKLIQLLKRAIFLILP